MRNRKSDCRNPSRPAADFGERSDGSDLSMESFVNAAGSGQIVPNTAPRIKTTQNDSDGRPTRVDVIEEAFERSRALRGEAELTKSIVVPLASEIISGSLTDGSKLTSLNLSKRFKTSRTPIRQALNVLAREGLINLETRKRPTINALSEEDIKDVYEIRSSLYSLIANDVVEYASDKDINRLVDALSIMETAAAQNNNEDYFLGTVRFRWTETDICHNRQVGPLIESLGLRTYRLRHLGLMQPDRMAASLRSYRNLYHSYLDRDVELAKATTSALMRAAVRTVLKAQAG